MIRPVVRTLALVSPYDRPMARPVTDAAVCTGWIRTPETVFTGFMLVLSWSSTGGSSGS